MPSYMRDIVGRCYKVTTHSHGERKVKEHRYSVEFREDVTTRTEFAWRLSCGHVLDGQQGHGKKRKTCWYCQWIDEGEMTKDEIDGRFAPWADLPSEAAYEAKRREAQS